jgi:signal transduction histidine kinase
MPAQMPGLAVLCDSQGIVTDILLDELNVAGGLGAGQSFTALLDRDCADKARSFLDAVRSARAAFNWELMVNPDGVPLPLHFAGGANDSGFLIIGAQSHAGVVRVYGELAAVANEQVKELRAAMKDLTREVRAQQERDSAFYDELSRLNNELANIQRELAKKNSELARLNEQKNQFLGIAAHDLRNPLNVIAAYSDFLLETASPVLSPQQLGFVAAIQSSSEFMLSLVNNLLDISKIEAGKLELDVTDADLAAIIEHNVSLNRALAKRRGIELLLHLEKDIPRLSLDVPKIEQVLNNLISNAIKFSPTGGHVRINVERRDEEVLISVEDEGPGVPAAELDRLFQPFEKSSVKSAGGEGHTGLGLVIVKKIVQRHGGRIWVESEAGKGAKFYVSLPLAFDGR